MPYTPSAPCRCGYDGTGVHRCHVGRPDPRTGEDGSRWCPHPAVEHLRAHLAPLAGVTLKFGAVNVAYCDRHYAEFTAGKDPTPPSEMT